MRIANPMYDAVFKHLLEDAESAHLIVGTILGEQIDEIELGGCAVERRWLLAEAVSDGEPEGQQLRGNCRRARKGALAPQESAVRVRPEDGARPGDWTVQRIDFAATVRTAGGERLRVLIEVQKSHFSDDVMRFRRYLGQHYADRGYVDVREGGSDERRALPLLTIYFLGRRLPRTEATVLKVARRYLDAVTGEELPRREDFVEALTHDCYVVQVPLLSDERRNDLERLLTIFDQRLRTDDRHILELDHADIPTAYAPVLRRLEAAAADLSVANSMALEDEVVGQWTRMQRDIAERDETIAERDETIRRQQAEIEALRRRATH